MRKKNLITKSPKMAPTHLSEPNTSTTAGPLQTDGVRERTQLSVVAVATQSPADKGSAG